MSTSCEATITVGTFFYPILFIILCVISIISINQLSVHNMEIRIKIMYFITLFFAFITNITSNILSIIRITCPDNEQLFLITNIFGGIGYAGGLVCILLILWLRLYVTFQESVFEISKQHKLIFVVFFTGFCIMDISTIITYRIYSVFFAISMSIAIAIYFGLRYITN